MARPAARIVGLQLALGAGLLLVIGRAGWLQLVRGSEYEQTAIRTRTERRELPARRGTIFDRNGTPLAISKAKYTVQLGIKEVKDTPAVVRLVSRQLGVPADSLRRIFARGKPLYPWFGGPFEASEVEPLRPLVGVHLGTVFSRAYLEGDLARPIVGALSPESGRGQSGMERMLDSVLAGRPGATIDLVDPKGRPFESPERRISDPVAGADVYLTIDAELQSIAEQSLEQALREYKAQGGDAVFLDPHTGDVLALASVTADGSARGPSTLVDVFQPGSTAKPFTAAALLSLGRVDPTETVSGEGGEWTYTVAGRRTRTIHDSHPQKGELTLERAIQVSSNIAMAKFSARLRPEEQFDMLRAFGFGQRTGVEFPAEASGALPRPSAQSWKEGYTAQSLAMGYEMNVTPLQLAAAYGALANDGVLVAPGLLREIRSATGTVIFRRETEVVRRVVSPEIATRLRGFLAEAASDSGTGGKAQTRYGILGKTGTTREMDNGRYVAGEFRGSFAWIFPAKDPQLVGIVTINRPRGAYYGGLTAAPLTATMIRQALNARGSAINRGALADATLEVGPVPAARAGRTEPATAEFVRLPLGSRAAPKPSFVVVPDVAGRGVRAAVFALHQRGLRVRVEGAGRAVRTEPAAGDSLAAGATVLLIAAAAKAP